MKNLGATFLLIALLIGCTKNGVKNEENGVKPSIKSFYPAKATSQDPVRIVGQGFSAIAQVSFGGVITSNFKIESDSVIIAYPGNAQSGSIEVRSAAGMANITGFILYAPETYKVTGTANFILNAWPQGNNIDTETLNDTATLSIIELNKYDTLRNRKVSVSVLAHYASEEGYVRILKIGADLRSRIATKSGFFKFSDAGNIVVYAKKTTTGYDIPMQPLFEGTGPYVIGTIIIANGKLSFTYKTEYRGSIKEATLQQ